MKVTDFSSFQEFLRLNDVFRRFNIRRIGVFGSFARGEKFNDIDLLLDERPKLKDRKALKDFLEKELNLPVDILIKDFTEPIILHRALADIRYATTA